MLEKRFYAVPPQAFTADGTTDGVVTIAANACILFKVKQKIYLSASGLPDLYLEIKEIDNEENIQVGPIPGTLNVPGANTGITARTDISAYTVALGAAIFADEQKRPAIDNIEIIRATYQEEPTAAVRSIMVDDCGNTVNAENPLPVSLEGTIQIGNVSIVEGGNTMTVNPDGSINVNLENSSTAPGLSIYYNEISSVASGATTAIYTFTAPSPGFRMFKIDVSGENIALYTLKKNGVTIFSKRTFYGVLNTTFAFEDFDNGLVLNTGDVLVVNVLHMKPYPANFEATLMGISL
jgi:hypothetical protein